MQGKTADDRTERTVLSERRRRRPEAPAPPRTVRRETGLGRPSGGLARIGNLGRAGLLRALLASHVATLAILAPGCEFDSTAPTGPTWKRVTVRMSDPAPPGVDCWARSRDVAWLFLQDPFGDLGFRLAVLPEEAERSPDGALCIYSARPKLRFLDSPPWEILAADEQEWVTECSRNFADVEVDDLGRVVAVEVTHELVFERGAEGCEREAIDG